jgi:hypothetical protein
MAVFGHGTIGGWLVSSATVRPAAEGEEPTADGLSPLRLEHDMLQWFGTISMMLLAVHNHEILAAPARTLVLSLDAAMPTFNVRGLERRGAELVAGPPIRSFSARALCPRRLVMASVGVYMASWRIRRGCGRARNCRAYGARIDACAGVAPDFCGWRHGRLGLGSCRRHDRRVMARADN